MSTDRADRSIHPSVKTQDKRHATQPSQAASHLVQHQVGDAAEVRHARLEVIDEPPGRCDDDLHAPPEVVHLLALRHAAVDARVLDAGGAPELVAPACLFFGVWCGPVDCAPRRRDTGVGDGWVGQRWCPGAGDAYVHIHTQDGYALLLDLERQLARGGQHQDDGPVALLEVRLLLGVGGGRGRKENPPTHPATGEARGTRKVRVAHATHRACGWFVVVPRSVPPESPRELARAWSLNTQRGQGRGAAAAGKRAGSIAPCCLLACCLLARSLWRSLAPPSNGRTGRERRRRRFAAAAPAAATAVAVAAARPRPPIRGRESAPGGGLAGPLPPPAPLWEASEGVVGALLLLLMLPPSAGGRSAHEPRTRTCTSTWCGCGTRRLARRGVQLLLRRSPRWPRKRGWRALARLHRGGDDRHHAAPCRNAPRTIDDHLLTMSRKRAVREAGGRWWR